MAFWKLCVPAIVLLAISSMPAISGVGNVMDCSSSNGSSPTNCTSSALMASIELYCDDRLMKAGFNTTELDANILPYTISFLGNNSCSRLTSANHTGGVGAGGQIWIEAGLAECGIEAFIEGENIVFEQTIIVEYGSKSKHQMIYRYFNDSYKVKCSMNRNITKDMQINVKERKTLSTKINQTATFDFDFNVMKKSDGQQVTGLVSIGETLVFDLNIQSDLPTIETSPQECYATRLDTTGQYNLIQDTCPGDDNSVKLVSQSNATHKFSWEMLAFRYFGDSDGVIINCRVLICTNDDANSPGGVNECSRCGEAPGPFRRRRALGDAAKGQIVESIVSSQPIFIIDRRGNSGNSASNTAEEEGLLSKPEGVALASVVGVMLLVGVVVFVKKMLFASGVAAAASAKAMAASGGVANAGLEA